MKTWTRWLWMLALLLAATSVQAGTKHYYYTDAQGTVLAKADAQGNIVASYDYTPYGVQVLGTPPSGPAGYTGHVNDAESGFVYMQQRYYDPVVGRFLSVDPVGVVPGNISYFNRYSYVKNNPATLTDPSGMCADYYEDGTCKVLVDKSIKDDDGAKKAQKKVEDVLNDYDKAINGLSDKTLYHVKGRQPSSGYRSTMTGKEIKTIWNSQHITIVPDDTKFNNGGVGSSTPGATRIPPGTVNAFSEYSAKAGVSTLVFHEFAHITRAGYAEYLISPHATSGSAFEVREMRTQTIGWNMANSVGAPFACSAYTFGCE